MFVRSLASNVSTLQAFQQHDAQELNRILFSAMEDSLVATEGERLIQRLYHGTIVNQVCLNRQTRFIDHSLNCQVMRHVTLRDI